MSFFESVVHDGVGVAVSVAANVRVCVGLDVHVAVNVVVSAGVQVGVDVVSLLEPAFMSVLMLAPLLVFDVCIYVGIGMFISICVCG